MKNTWATALVVLSGLGALAPVAAETAPGAKTRNVVLIVTDGLRWQEVFSGADPLLLNDKAGGSWMPVDELRQKYWRDDPNERRRLLMPFLWGTVAARGQIYGNQQRGSRAEVTNDKWFSYPGYNEMASGVADARIDKNEFGPNPNGTVFEWLNAQPGLAGKVEIFGTWNTFHDIFNEARSHLPIRAGATLLDRSDKSARGQLLAELDRTTTALEPGDPYDSFLYQAVADRLRTHQPRVLFVGFGDTDNWAHSGRYDAVLEATHHVDDFIGRLWQQMQANPAYRDCTTFIITTDHGRGGGLTEWKDHGIEEQGSGNIWIAVIGPDTPALGERANVATVTQAQIAATVAAFVGQDYRKSKPAAASPLPVLP
jgi:Type I phosphodiesterase / nucleotide pyrophosphatase